MKSHPNQPGCQRKRREPPAPCVRRVPDQPQRNNGKSKRHDQLNRPNRNSISQDFAAGLFGLRQLPGSQTKKYRDARGKGAAEAARESLPAAFEESGQGGERQQAAVARGKHSAEETDDQNQVLLKGSRALQTAVKNFASNDLDEGEKHQRGQCQRDQEVFRIPKPTEAATRLFGDGERVGNSRIPFRG